MIAIFAPLVFVLAIAAASAPAAGLIGTVKCHVHASSARAFHQISRAEFLQEQIYALMAEAAAVHENETSSMSPSR